MYQVDQQFHLRKEFVSELAQRPVPWGGGLLSKATFYRTYSRRKELGGQEHFHDVVVRNIEGVMRIRKTWYKLIGQRWDDREWQERAQHYANLMFDMKWLPPGRSLYAMGTEYVYERGNAALNNCGFVDVVVLSEAAAWLMDHLMLGVGVGVRIKNGGFDSLQTPKGSPRTYRIPDSREGWVESVRLLIESYEDNYDSESRTPITFDYSDIRPKGSLIRGFGGVASGPEP